MVGRRGGRRRRGAFGREDGEAKVDIADAGFSIRFAWEHDLMQRS